MRVSAIILALSISAIAYPVQDSIEGDEILATEEESGDVCYEAKVIKSKSTVRHRRHSYHRKNPTSTLNTGAGSVTSTSIFSSIASASNPVSTGKGTSSSFKSDTSSSIVASPASTRLTSASSTTSPSLTASPSLTTSSRLTTSASLTPSPSSTAFSPSSTTASPSLTTSPSLKTSASQSISRTTTNTSSTASPTQSAQPVALRGVNIGHWLVIEPWMDDGILMSGKFKNAPDQWTFDSLDTDGSYIKQHWDTWFTQGDAQRLKNYGFNALRIPIGYWAFNNENTPFRKGAMEYMDKAIVWARNIGMKVMIDCHGSPGSQNGQMHSGHQDAVQWQQGSNLNLSTIVLQQMVQRWGTIENADTVFAIEIVNEPTANAPNSFTKSQSWASDTYQAIQRTISNGGLSKTIQILTHDSFMGIKKFIPYASNLVSPINRPTFGVDQHNYQLYTDTDNSLDQPGHIKKACSWADDLAMTRSSMPTYVGEWSALTNICVDSNGTTFPLSPSPSSGKQPYVPGSCTIDDSKSWNPQLLEQVRRYVEAQLDTYEANSDGHFIWSFKAGGGWGLYNLIDVGVFPQPITQRRYPGQCS